MKPRTKRTLWALAALMLVAALAAVYWVRRFQNYTPVAAVQDLRAAIAARHDPKPVEKFLELRYGPLTEPANRQKAFVEFFNVGHIEGLHLIVTRMPAERREGSIRGMAQWVAQYRQTLSPEEKQSLRDYLNSDTGRLTLRQATAKYLSHDVRYRSARSPVIEELMATLAEVQKP